MSLPEGTESSPLEENDVGVLTLDSQKFKEIRDNFPAGAIADQMFGKYLRRAKIDRKGVRNETEGLREVLNHFLLQELNNFDVFESKRGVRFPFTFINIAILAKAIYQSKAGKIPENLSEKDHKTRKSKKVFVWGTSMTPTEGHPFNRVEEVIQRCMPLLRRALADIQQGNEPTEDVIYTMGMPTNEFGSIPENLVDKIRQNPFGELGFDYAEFVKQRFSDNESVILDGASLGANFAMVVGWILKK